MQSFVAMQQCMLAHPDAFAEYAEPANGEATAAGAAAGDASSKGSVKSASSQ